MFGLQALVNIGVVLGSLPTKGLPLPFISYGGTSLVMSLFMAGVLANISARNPEPRELAAAGGWAAAPSRAPTARTNGRAADRRGGGRPAGGRSRRPAEDRLDDRPSACARSGSSSRAAARAGTSIPASRSPRRSRPRAGRCSFVGTSRGLETKLVPAAGFPLELLEVSGLKRMGLRGTLRGLFRLPRAWFESRRILRRYRPDVVLGVGGYASGPLVFAAALLGYPTAIQEQNSLPGFTNRMLGRFVRRVFVAFDEAAAPSPAARSASLGNPVRRTFLDGAAAAAAANPGAGRSILVLGGSQGAHAVNDLASGLARGARRARAAAAFVHQTGADDVARMQVGYAAHGYEGARRHLPVHRRHAGRAGRRRAGGRRAPER